MAAALHPAERASRASGLRPGGGVRAVPPPSCGERVTLGDEAREASRALPPVPSSDVRWYRAARAGPAAPAVAAPGRAGRPVHVAVAAYMRLVTSSP